MKLTVSVAQMKVVRAGPEENLKRAGKLIAEASRRKSDLVCLPEMWTTGFNWTANERMVRDHENVIEQIAKLARDNRIWINGSTLGLSEDGRCANVSILFDPEGNKKAVYRKTHLFSMLHEDMHVASGDRLCVADAPWGLTGLSVCYDIRFPEIFRAYAVKGAKIVLSPMAFPSARLSHWQILSRARAIENQLYLVGANQVGSEDFGPDGEVVYAGHSVIIDPWGRTILEGGPEEEVLLTAAIDTKIVDDVRATMSVLKDRRPELYNL